MKTLLMLVFCATLVAEKPGAEGHGGGGELAEVYRSAQNRLQYTIVNIKGFKSGGVTAATHLRLQNLAPHLAPAVRAVKQFELREEETDKNNCLEIVGATGWLAPKRCRREAASEERAIVVLSEALLSPLVPAAEVTELSEALRRFSVEEPRYDRTTLDARDYGTFDELEKGLHALAKRDGIPLGILTTDGYFREMLRAQKKVVRALGPDFPSRKPEWLGVAMWNWLINYRSQLARALESSWLVLRATKAEARAAGQQTCAWTKGYLGAPIYISFEDCRDSVVTNRQFMQTLAHEATHNLGIADEAAADRVGAAVSRLYNGSQDSEVTLLDIILEILCEELTSEVNRKFQTDITKEETETLMAQMKAVTVPKIRDTQPAYLAPISHFSAESIRGTEGLRSSIRDKVRASVLANEATLRLQVQAFMRSGGKTKR